LKLDQLLNSNFQIHEKIDLEYKYLISFTGNCENELLKANNKCNVNVCIASAITSYSRIVMTFFKHFPGFKVYYYDSECIDLNKPLPLQYIGKELGKMKLEHI
jgi:hypothetical protein